MRTKRIKDQIVGKPRIYEVVVVCLHETFRLKVCEGQTIEQVCLDGIWCSCKTYPVIEFPITKHRK